MRKPEEKVKKAKEAKDKAERTAKESTQKEAAAKETVTKSETTQKEKVTNCIDSIFCQFLYILPSKLPAKPKLECW